LVFNPDITSTSCVENVMGPIEPWKIALIVIGIVIGLVIIAIVLVKLIKPLREKVFPHEKRGKRVTTTWNVSSNFASFKNGM